MFYEIYRNGEPTGMGSTDRTMAYAMSLDYAAIYGGKITVEVQPDEQA